MGCTASTAKVVEPSITKSKHTATLEMKAECDQFSNRTEPNLIIDTNTNLTSTDLGQFTSERKESSLPEVDKDLRMDQQKAEEGDVEIKVEGFSGHQRHEEKEEIEDSDSFDTSQAPLSRDKISSLKINHPMKDTMNFIYQHSSSSSPSHLGGSFQTFNVNSPRHTNRRPSGVPPPPRALKDSDFLTKFGEGKDLRKPSITMEEEEPPEENTELKNGKEER